MVRSSRAVVRTAAAGSAGALVLSGALVLPPGTSLASDAGAAAALGKPDCAKKVDDQRLRVRIKWVLPADQEPPYNDLAVERIVVRATDNNERGVFRERAVRVDRVKVTIDDGREKRTVGVGKGSPYKVELDPVVSVFEVIATVTFKLGNGARVKVRYADHFENLDRCRVR